MEQKQQQIVQMRRQMEQKQQQIVQMRRPGKGRIGRPVDLVCNHFRVGYRHTQDVYQYTVSIEPEVRNKTRCREVVAKLYDVYGRQQLAGKNYAFDGEKILYVMGELPFHSEEFKVILDDDRRPGRRGLAGPSSPSEFEEESRKKRRVNSGQEEFTVKVVFAALIDMGVVAALTRGQQTRDSQDALRVLDVVLREHAARRGCILIRESFFHVSTSVRRDISEGVESWTGYDVSFRPTERGISLNLDLSTTTMMKPLPVTDFLKEHFRKSPTAFYQADWVKAKKLLKGIRIETQHTGLKHKIIGLSGEPAKSLRFARKVKDQNGVVVNEEQVNILDYYQTTYNIRLRDPLLPCLDVGRAKRPVYLPLEFCKILPGQRYVKKLSVNQRQKLILESRQPPDLRRDLVRQALDETKYQVDQLIKDFNIQIDRELVPIKGRILDAPSLKFREFKETPRNGRWNLNNKVMERGSQIQLWAVANFCPNINDQNAKAHANSLQACCRAKGMMMADVHGIYSESRNMQDRDPITRVKSLLQIMQASLPKAPDLIFCILPAKGCNLYAPFKRECQNTLGIISQCIVPPVRVNDQFYTNIALKINVKCGGYNSVLSSWLPCVKKAVTMIFGLDLSHGVTGDYNATTIAAVVASTDVHFARYTARVRTQQARSEMVHGLCDEPKNPGMVRQLLYCFWIANKRKPQQIIIFRDGVSESQFEHVLQRELIAFKKAFQEVEDGYNPQVTVIVVQKRHHTRIFPSRGNANVPPGTIVDTEITHPQDYDFFLCSHMGSDRGTSRPTHYTVLHDEIQFTPDDLQQLTNYLCYVYARSTTAISVVAPVYYAHLAAKHCQNCLDGDDISETTSQTSETSSQAGRASRDKLNLHKDIKDKMFFC